MKLTNALRDDFINSVLNGLNKIDYISQVQELLNKDAFNNLPDVLKNKDIQHYLESKRIYFSECRCLGAYYVRNKEYEPTDEIKNKVKVLNDLFAQQRDKKQEIYKQLRAIIYNVTTLNKAKEVLPEDLHKYLPVEKVKDEKPTSLVTNELMSTLIELGLKK